MKIGRALAGGHLPSIAKAIFAHNGVREEVLLKVMDLIKEEVDSLCRKVKENEPPSPFRHIPVTDLESFSFQECVRQLQEKSPFLYRLMVSLVQRNDHRNKSKRGDSHIPGICTAVAIMLKERNNHMCGVQTYLSLALYTSQVPKKVRCYVIHGNNSITFEYNNVYLKYVIRCIYHTGLQAPESPECHS